MDFKEVCKRVFEGFKPYEIICLTIVFGFIFINALVNHDSIIAVLSAVCGISYTFLAGKGRVSCYLFGVCGSGFYSYLSFINNFWGNLVLYLCYYIPMQILGFFKWKKHLKTGSNEIEKIRLSNKERLYTLLLTVFACLVVAFVLNILHDKNPIVDAVTTVGSVAGMYFTVRRAIEQWYAWLIVNFLSTLMWLQVLLQGEKVYATVIMWATYTLLAVYFCIVWHKDMAKNIKNM